MRGVLYLASTSSRRRDLLRQAGIEFVLHSPGVEPAGRGSPEELVRLRARAKAADSVPPPAGGLVLGVDTVVDCDGVELGKPLDRDDAAAMLRRLMGGEHRVLTGHCLVSFPSGSSAERLAASRVRCQPLSDAELAAYLDAGDWHDKAGAYGIQGVAGSFMELVDGELDTVIGLNVAMVQSMLEVARSR